MGEDEYSVRLSKTKLLSLEMRRLRSDLIEVFKIMHNLEQGRATFSERGPDETYRSSSWAGGESRKRKHKNEDVCLYIILKTFITKQANQ